MSDNAAFQDLKRKFDPAVFRSKMISALNAARSKLLERSLRNKLISTNLTSQRARQIRVVDELSDEIFAVLRNGKAMTFSANKRWEGINADANNSDELPYVPPDDVTGEGVAARHRDQRLQTRLTPEGLQKRLLSLFHEAQTIEEEQGVNVLYLALGFLEWREANHSELARFAPLVLLPIDLARDGAKDRFKIRLRDEDIFTNVCLQAWLEEQFGIKLPDLPDDDWKPRDYFESVRTAIGVRSGWTVHDNEIVAGFFSFAKFLLWRDLDPSNWPNEASLLQSDILSRVLLREETDSLVDTPIIAEDARIDEVFKPRDLVHVADADSSQAIAIQEALSGKNLVIQGPPGTGKSQTITNIIAGAVHAGKRVLFIAEKMAALEVVHRRLAKQGLGAMCLELHSRKTSKAQVLEQIKQGMVAPAPPGWSEKAFSDLEDTQKQLRQHSDSVHATTNGSLSAFQLMGRMSLLKARGAPTPTFVFPKAADWKAAEIETAIRRVDQLGERLKRAGIPACHPWRGMGISVPDRLEQDRIRPLVDLVNDTTAELREVVALVRDILCPLQQDSLGGLLLWDSALKCIAQRPEGVDEMLCQPDLRRRTAEIREVSSVGQKLTQLAAALHHLVTASAWERDWQAIRETLVRHGQSPFRFLFKDYRDAVKCLREVSLQKLSSRWQDRVHVVDSIVEGQRLKALVQTAACASAVSHLWRGEQTDWPLLLSICDWLDRTGDFVPNVDLCTSRALVEPRSAAELSKSLLESRDGFVNSFTKLKQVIVLDEALAFDGREFESLSTTELLPICHRWKQNFALIVDWPPLRDDLAWLTGIGCEQLAQRVFRGDTTASEVSPLLQVAAYEAMWRAAKINLPEIESTSGDELSKVVQRFRKADEDRIVVAADQVAKAHVDKHPTGSAGAVGVLRDEVRKARRLKPVRKLMDEAGEAIQRFKPVFLMSPLSVAQYLKPGCLTFDVLLIDEASQVRPEDAIGAIARCNQLVVVGDDRQLPPTNFFNRVVNDEDGMEDEEEDQKDDVVRAAAVRDVESILNLCSRFPERMLRWHYRSEHPILIATSNRHFYANKLMLPPSVIAKATDGRTGLLFHKVKEGGYERGTTARNVIEADDVAHAVAEHVRTSAHLSLGIGTFSSAQRDAIRNRLDLVAATYPDVDEFMKTPPNGEGLFVKNLENIQGDERDVIFISIGYGRDKDGRLTQNFGPVGREGGDRRLNVLITRARKRCEVFSSIVADDIRFDGAGKPGVVALKEFLKLAKDGYSDIASPTGKSFDSDFEESVAHAINTLGFDYHPQVGMAGFYIDIGVLDPRKPDRYILGIECDGAAYHSSRYCRDRDRLRQKILESRGWRIHRIWSTDWFYQPGREVEKLKAILEDILSSGPAPAAANTEPEVRLGATDESRRTFEQKTNVNQGKDDPTINESKLCSYKFAEVIVPEKLNTAPHRLGSQRLYEIVSEIVRVEQPIHQEEVGRRLAASFNLQRAGNLIQEAATHGLQIGKRRGLLESAGPFWSAIPHLPVEPRDRSLTPMGSPVRRPECIAPAEYQAAVRIALRRNLAMNRNELIVEVARLLGFARTGSELADEIGDAIATLLGNEARLDHLDRICLSDPTNSSSLAGI